MTQRKNSVVFLALAGLSVFFFGGCAGLDNLRESPKGLQFAGMTLRGGEVDQEYIDLFFDAADELTGRIEKLPDGESKVKLLTKFADRGAQTLGKAVDALEKAKAAIEKAKKALGPADKKLEDNEAPAKDEKA